MKKMFIILAVVIISAFIYTSCDNLPPGFSEYLSIQIDDTVIDNTAEWDFGITEAGASGKTTSLSITNNHTAAITVTGITLDNSDNYSIEIPSLPFTAEPGASKEVSLTYNPQSGAIHNAVINISIEGAETDFILNLTGTGNYAPQITFGIDISGAGNNAANGFYLRDGFLNSGMNRRANYTKTGTSNYYCYNSENPDYNWSIDDTQTSGEISPEYYNAGAPALIPPTSSWLIATGLSPAPTVDIYDISGPLPVPGVPFTVTYYYSDADGDAEKTGESYQWYRSTVEEGTYTGIDGETLSSYTTANDDIGYFIKVAVTTSSATGLNTPVTVMSSPTPQIIGPS